MQARADKNLLLFLSKMFKKVIIRQFTVNPLINAGLFIYFSRFAFLGGLYSREAFKRGRRLFQSSEKVINFEEKKYYFLDYSNTNKILHK